MENFLFSLNATMPVFFVIVLGWVLMQVKLFNKEFLATADKYVFKVALPVLLFKDIATTNLREDMDWKFVFFCMAATTIMFFGVWGLATIFMKDKSMIGAFTQASVRGSAAILGVAFVQNIYGNSAMAPLMIVAAVPLFNVYAVIILTFCSSENKGADRGAIIKKAMMNVLKNPIIIGIALGVPFSLLGITLPAMLSKTVTNIANTATPIALLVVGANFEGSKALARLKPAVIATLLKLLIVPGVFFPAALAMGFTGSKLVAILVMLGSPTTVTCYIMAKNMGNDAELSSSGVVLATLFSSVTLTFWIFLMKTMMLI